MITFGLECAWLENLITTVFPVDKQDLFIQNFSPHFYDWHPQSSMYNILIMYNV